MYRKDDVYATKTRMTVTEKDGPLDLVEQVTHRFTDEPTLRRSFPNYALRDEQLRLAIDIAETLLEGRKLIAEAETGIGKSLAYLVPSLLWDGRVVICTHTKALQEQLIGRELPLAMKVAGRVRKIALLKGRRNYLCLHRLNRYLQSHRLPPEKRDLLSEISAWSERSADGDLAGLGIDLEHSGVHHLVTASVDQCFGRECEFWSTCPLRRARLQALDADIVIANHSLLLADTVLKQGDFGEVLPDADAYILDEAHDLATACEQTFGNTLTRHCIIHWGNDALATIPEHEAKELSQRIACALDAFSTNGPASAIHLWKPVREWAEARAESVEGMRRLAERSAEIEQQMAEFLDPPEGFVAWMEGEGETRRCILAPIDPAACLSRALWSKRAAFVLLSATMRGLGGFDHCQKRLGIQDAHCQVYRSPFDYRKQSLIYIPKHLPFPGQKNYESALLEQMKALLYASRGRAFVLCSSHKSLSYFAPRLQQMLPWRVLIQGIHGNKEALLDAFRADVHSVLCGTRGFWEGVDMPGATLSIVILEKLPFPPPDAPLIAARMRACEEKGQSGFREILLSEAIAVMRQGFGRLIRTTDDRGVMALLDARVHARSYGKSVLEHLPDASIVDEIDAVKAFFKETSCESLPPQSLSKAL